VSRSALTVSLDQGGHSSRAIVFDECGRVVAAAHRVVEEQRLATDRVEQDPEALALSLRECLDEVCLDLGSSAENITKIGLATQRSSIVCWSANDGHALSPVLSWQDRRAAAWLSRFEREAERVREITGLFLSPHYGVSKMAWCLSELSEVQAARETGELRIGPLASFLAMQLLGTTQAPVDPCNAGRTLLFDLKALDWSDELLSLFDIPREILPSCKPTRSEFGEVKTPVGNRPLAILSGDQPAALYAHGAPEEGAIHVNLGTGAFVLRPLSRTVPAPARLLTSVSCSDRAHARYVVEGTVNGAASALDWAAQELGVDEWEKSLDAWLAAESAPPLFLNGVGGLGSPFWVPNLESRWVGEGNLAAKMTAVAESVLFLVKRNIDEMGSLEPQAESLRVTGGLSNSDELCARLAKLSGLRVERPVVREATARGTAFWLTGEPQNWPALGEPTVFEAARDTALNERYERWLAALEVAIA